MDIGTEWADLTPEEKDRRIEEAVAHDIAIWEQHRAEMGPEPPSEAEELATAIIDRLGVLERRLLACVSVLGLGAIVTMIVMLRR